MRHGSLALLALIALGCFPEYRFRDAGSTCGSAGVACSGDTACCPGLACRDGRCGPMSVAEDAATCRAVGASCAAHDDCCDGLCNSTICRACTVEGQACSPTASDVCCGSLVCLSTATCGPCATLGQRCDVADCCDGRACLPDFDLGFPTCR